MSNTTALMEWIEEGRKASEEWCAKTVAGSEDRPWVVDGVRRLCLVRTNEGRWGVIDHGGWTESPINADGSPATIGSYTAGDLPPDWYANEQMARASFALSAGRIDRAKLLEFVAANLDALIKVDAP